MRVADKVIVVTGGASGIGKGLCLRFHEEGARAVAVADIDEAGARGVAEKVGGLAVRCDVSVEPDVVALVKETERRFGPIDLFCSNAGIAVADPEGEGELFYGETPSNRQLQIAGLAACAWSLWLALRTRTVALSSCFTTLAILFHLAVLTDFGLRSWLEDGRWDLLALYLLPLLFVAGALGGYMESRQRGWFARPLFSRRCWHAPCRSSRTTTRQRTERSLR